jgi:hypothetical protein
LCVAIIHSLKGFEGPVAQVSRLACAGVLALALLAGMLLGVIALCGIPKHGTQGILWPAVRGLVVSGAVLWLGVIGFVDGLRNGLILRQAHETARQAEADLKRDLAPGNNPRDTVQKQQASLAKIKGALDTVSENTSGTTALIARVASAHVAQGQVLAKEYGLAMSALREASVLGMSGVTTREQLAPRKELVRKFMAANDKLQGFIARRSESFRADMLKAGVPNDKIEEALKGYQKAAAQQDGLVMKIREDDRTMGTGMLGMLDLLDANWGRWSYNAERKKVIFKDPATLGKYQSCLKAVQAAGQDQELQQAKIASLPTI